MSRASVLTILAIAAAILLAASVKPGKTTHLGVPSNVLVNLQTFQLLNNNSSESFWYDRTFGGGESVFGPIPEKTSFVVTDIFIHPGSSDPSAHYLIVVQFEGARSFTVQFDGSETRHYPLAGGIVISANRTPTGRNTTLSDYPAEIQLLGYFTKGGGLPAGQPTF